MKRSLNVLTAAGVALLAAACSKDARSAQTAETTRTDSAAGLVIPPSTPYKEGSGSAQTALVVKVPGDSGATSAAPACGSTPTDQTVFWVDGIREGKPLPDDRRYQLVSSDCGMDPRLQAVVVGGTINVFNDAGVHRLVFLRAGTNDTLQTMPFFENASMVATERLTKTAGVVEVRCAAHPAERAYIAVFDNPYFGVASSGDKVTLDAVPAGDYRVMTWHEGLAAPTSVPAKVGPTGQTEIVLR